MAGAWPRLWQPLFADYTFCLVAKVGPTKGTPPQHFLATFKTPHLLLVTWIDRQRIKIGIKKLLHLHNLQIHANDGLLYIWKPESHCMLSHLPWRHHTGEQWEQLLPTLFDPFGERRRVTTRDHPSHMPAAAQLYVTKLLQFFVNICLLINLILLYNLALYTCHLVNI